MSLPVYQLEYLFEYQWYFCASCERVILDLISILLRFTVCSLFSRFPLGGVPMKRVGTLGGSMTRHASRNPVVLQTSMHGTRKSINKRSCLYWSRLPVLQISIWLALDAAFQYQYFSFSFPFSFSECQPNRNLQ